MPRLIVLDNDGSGESRFAFSPSWTFDGLGEPSYTDLTLAECLEDDPAGDAFGFLSIPGDGCGRALEVLARAGGALCVC